MGETAWSAATGIPIEGKSSVSAEQRETLDAILRQSAFPADSDVNEQRRLLRELLSAQPLPAGLAAQIARRTRARVISVDYRLAPRAPVPGRGRRRSGRLPGPPAGGTDPADIAFPGESAGAGHPISR